MCYSGSYTSSCDFVSLMHLRLYIGVFRLCVQCTKDLRTFALVIMS